MGEPPHIHVSGHGGAAKVWLNPVRFADAQGFKSSDLKRILEVAGEHRNEFLEAWDEFFQLVQRG